MILLGCRQIRRTQVSTRFRLSWAFGLKLVEASVEEMGTGVVRGCRKLLSKFKKFQKFKIRQPVESSRLCLSFFVVAAAKLSKTHAMLSLGLSQHKSHFILNVHSF